MPRFVPRQRKHKVLARQKAQGEGLSAHVDAPQSTNQDIVVPQSKAEREEKKRALREELRAQQSKVSSKKQKRLDKYIETKLRKDETLDLLRKLEKEKTKYESTLASKGVALGKRNFEDFVKGSIPERNNKSFKPAEPIDDDDSEDSFEEEHREVFKDEGGPQEPSMNLNGSSAVVGSGLAQPLALDENGLPIIQSRQSKKRKKIQDDIQDDLPWDGFDTEPSEADSKSDIEEVSGSEGGDAEDDSGSDDSLASSDADNDSDDSDDSDDDNEDSESSNSDITNEGGDQKIKPRNSVFKLWATQQLNQAVGHTPSYKNGEGELLPAPKPATKPQNQTLDPSKPTPPLDSVPNRKAYAVQVDRPEDIQQSRSELPILQREQEIMEAIHNNPVVIVKGDTGSGKTTQIPQFLFEAGYGSPEGPTPGIIGITQPRRVAAVSMAKRVGTELGKHGNKVAYQIRFDSTVSSNTAVKFMTDGILLRELSQDLLLRKYSVIVIDEAHERSVNTDILIGMLSKVVPARMQKSKFNPDPKPLKLVIMSATLNIDDFLHQKLFSPDVRPPIVEAEGRQHRVTTHFALKSRSDYVEEVIEKVRRAHRKLPRGGILVFLTGQNEIRQVSTRLRALLSPKGGSQSRANIPRVELAASEAPLETEDMELGPSRMDEDQDDFELEILTPSDDEAEEKEFEISDDEEEDEERGTSTRLAVSTTSKEPYDSVHILPLYSQLPTTEQLKVFDSPPPGSRLIVLATNVAETSLTIPGIRFVFDTGRSKERKYNLDTGVQSFEIDYISKASAQQRAGRAGRTGPGHCWRLYTSAVYEQFFPDHADPEILRAPAESVVLQLKGFAYPRPIAEFPFPTPPAAQTLNKAERLLKNLGALTTEGTITEIGRQLSIYPLSPRLGKILALGIASPNLLWPILAVVSALAVPEIFVPETQLGSAASSSQQQADDNVEDEDEDDDHDALKQSYGRARATLTKTDKTSDAMKLLTATTLYLHNQDSSTSRDRDQDRDQDQDICASLFLRPKAMGEIAQLKAQLEHLVRANHRASITAEVLAQSRSRTKLSSLAKLAPQLNALVAAGYIDNLAVRWDLAPGASSLDPSAGKPRRAIDVPYLPLQPLHARASATLLSRAVFIHPSSVLSRLTVKNLPAYICYSHLQLSQPHHTTTVPSALPKTRMFPLCALTARQIFQLARDTALLRYGKPLPKSVVAQQGPNARECWVGVEIRAPEAVGGLGWALPPVKVRQRRDVKSRDGWVVERVLS